MVRAIAFIDGQNLFGAVRDAFGVRAPSFGVVALSHAVAAAQGWEGPRRALLLRRAERERQRTPPSRLEQSVARDASAELVKPNETVVAGN